MPISEATQGRLFSYVFPPAILKRLRRDKLRKHKLALRSQIVQSESYQTRLRRWIILLVAGILAWIQGKGGHVVARATYAVLRKVGLPVRAIDRLRTTVDARVRAKNRVHANPIIWLAEASEHALSMSDKNASLLAGHSEVHIFLEPGARLPKHLGGDAFLNTKFVVYSFADVSGEIAKLGVRDNVVLAPLRDRFNDISPEGVNLFESCLALANSLSREIMNTALSSVPNVQGGRFEDVLATGIYDQITHRLTLTKCYFEAMSTVPKQAGVLLVAASDRYFVNGWSMLSPALDPAHTFAVFGQADDEEATQFRKALIEVMLTASNASSGRNDGSPNEDRTRSTMTRLSQHFQDQFARINRVSLDYADQIRTWAGADDIALFAHAGDAKAYVETLSELGRELIQSAPSYASKALFIHCAEEPERAVTPELLKTAEGVSAAAIDLNRYAGAIDNLRGAPALHMDMECLVLEIMHNYVAGEVAKGADVIVPDVVRVMMSQVCWIYAAYTLSVCLSQQVGVSGVLASPSRQILVRALCAGLLDYNESNVPVIDVQSMNILPHPKYVSPMATDVAVIDSTAFEIYKTHFGISADKIHVVGNASNDILRQTFRASDAEASRARIGVSADTPVVLFISQLQPIERMLDIVEPLAQSISECPSGHLIIRLHPRETDERIEAYREVVVRHLSADQFSFSGKDEAPIEILSVSDLCVTIYSNMAREAAVLGKPVIVADYFDWQRPIRLEDEGLAIAATSQDELQALVQNHLLRDVAMQNSSPQNAYLQKNSHLLEGRAAERILSIMEKKNVPRARHLRKGVAVAGKGQVDKDKTGPLSDWESAVIILPQDIRPSQLPNIFSNLAEISVYAASSKLDLGLLPPYASIIDGTYNLENSEMYDAAVSSANQVAWSSVSAFVQNSVLSASVQAHFKRLERALWLMVRPGVIKAYLNMAVLYAGIEKADGSAIIIVDHDADTTYHLLSKVNEFHGKTNRAFVLPLGSEVAHELVSATDWLKRFERASRQEKADSLETGVHNKRLEKWLRSTESYTFDIPQKGRVLAATDWALKTVPATFAPVLADCLKRNEAVVAVSARKKFTSPTPDIEKQAEFVPTSELRALATCSFVEEIGLPPKNTRGALSGSLVSRLQHEDWYRDLPGSVRSAVSVALKNLAHQTAWEALAFDAYSDAFFSFPGAISIACPGRQWHAEIAHMAAEKSGALSITLQNAYMTAGYTYTKPTGQYVTAIDAWSKSLFIDHYRVDERKVHVISTPRFDAYASRRNETKAQARARLQLSLDEHVILFAGQVGLDDDTRRVVEALAPLSLVHGRGVRTIVKLHPRSSENLLAQMRAAAESVNPNHTIEIINSGDVADYIIASDIVSTVFSNVAIEAAIVGRDVLIIKLDNRELPLPMDLFGIGAAVSSEAELVDTVPLLLEQSAFAKAQRKRQEVWRSENQIMVRGKSRETLAQLIQDALARPEKIAVVTGIE